MWADSETHRRYMQSVAPRSRRRCNCGCRQRATHVGMANGCALVSGCELSIRRWVRDGIKASRAAQRGREE